MYLVKEVTKCTYCEGTGYIYVPYCVVCGRIFDYPRDLSAGAYVETFLPCGHEINCLREKYWCVECEGQGEISRTVDLKDVLIELGVL